MEHSSSARNRVKAALAVWQERVAPLFDVAQQLRLVEFESEQVIREQTTVMPDVPAASKAIRLVELGVQVLVCGAISEALQAMIMAHGIRVIPFLAGDINELEQALVSGSLDIRAFAMPGWRKRSRPPRPVRRSRFGTTVMPGIRSEWSTESRLGGRQLTARSQKEN